LLLPTAQAAFLCGYLDDARDALNEALALLASTHNPWFAPTMHQLGMTFFSSGSLTEAARAYTQAFEQAAASGLWDTAVMASDGLADCAQYQGRHSEFWSHLDRAIELARSRGLSALERTLTRKRILREIALDPTGEALGSLKSVKEQRRLSPDELNRLLLAAEYLIHRNHPEDAIRLLRQAEEQIPQDSPDRWNLLWNWAAACDVAGRLTEALQYAEQALAIAEEHQVQDQIRVSLLQLISFYMCDEVPEHEAKATKGISRLREIGPPQTLAYALLEAGRALFERRQYEKALHEIAEAERVSDTLDLRGLVFTGRAATLQAMGRLTEALAANEHAITLGKQQLLPIGAAVEGATASARWGRAGRVDHVETLYGNAALLLAQTGQLRQAFDRAEQGKAWRLRSELAQADRSEARAEELSLVTLEELRAAMKADGAAMALLYVGVRRALVLVIDPHLDELEHHVVDVGDAETRSLRQHIQTAREPWPANVLKTLSERLMPALDRVSRNCSVLCLVPDSHLYFTPFAALTFSDRSRLIDRCALALAPSATVLAWLRARRAKGIAPSCLAVGIGGEDVIEPSGRRYIAFADQAREVAALGWLVSRSMAESTVAEFWKQAPGFSVLHIVCHGEVEPATSGTLSASVLQFGDQRISAREVFDHEFELKADLVFLNACVSGRFDMGSGSEVGGFWEAFIRAGAQSLIGTLTKVDPEMAHELALEFYRQWLAERVSKAEALRRAQVRLANRGVEARHWASHLLIGDYS
jgi:CHAT domain-containing protein